MTLSSSLVEVRTITCNRPRSNFDQQKIEQAANLIVAAEGIINPIIVSRTGINSFQVIDGHFEYYAAARARELNLEIGEAIAAYIVEEKNETIIKDQVAIFRQPLPPQDRQLNTDNLETRLTNIESRIENRLNELKSEYTQKNKELEQKIDSLKSKLPEKIEPLTTFNEANLIELVSKLKLVLRSDKKANDIAPKIIAARPFKSSTEVLENVRGLGDKTMLRIIDSWLYS
ncbi:ParB N-terminal domain-containing protein [Pleurocapsa sp. FMAR1]|uniref:ParB N-terminal domain-containing protein n=1 Tax=Pleurocapsa sp. FMAR1 TaxID=3040204 RepID=UPI0029C96313|nr:ParB N-terminal domain-containing protein [Pleurocapsa sp. FMAR1]